jgi:exonuclease VII large subunit
MDMFSLGILLLYAVNPGLYRQWFLDIEALDAFVQGKQKALDGEMDRLNKELQTLSSTREAMIQSMPETVQKKQKLQALQERQKKLIIAQQEIEVRWVNLQAEYKTRYVELHKRLQEQVQRDANPHCPLIFDLLSYKPEDRPTAEQAEARFVSVPA